MSSDHVVLDNLTVPTVFRKRLDWKLCEWNLDDWALHLGDSETLPLRIGGFRCSKTPLWERSCNVDFMEPKDYFKLLKSDTTPDWKWFYFDYKPLAVWFKEKELFKDLSWNCLDPDISTPNGFSLWIGTSGAHTPMHYDSYGTNIVGQVYGRKLWILFPPNVSHLLLPTRVPYEESSVYSSYNMFCNCGSIPDEALSVARFIILEPGDILFIPCHWWHYVESLSPAISINSWIPLKDGGDDINRLEESLVREFISSFIRDLSKEEALSILNPTEDDMDLKVTNLQIIKHVLQSCKANCKKQLPSTSSVSHLDKCVPKDTLDGNMIDKSQLASGDSVKNDELEKQDDPKEMFEVPIVGTQVIRDWLKGKCLKNLPLVEQVLRVDPDIVRIINSVCAPDIVKIMRERLLGC